VTPFLHHDIAYFQRYRPTPDIPELNFVHVTVQGNKSHIIYPTYISPLNLQTSPFPFNYTIQTALQTDDTHHSKDRAPLNSTGMTLFFVGGLRTRKITLIGNNMATHTSTARDCLGLTSLFAMLNKDYVRNLYKTKRVVDRKRLLSIDHFKITQK
jgi:hypothetical protein